MEGRESPPDLVRPTRGEGQSVPPKRGGASGCVSGEDQSVAFPPLDVAKHALTRHRAPERAYVARGGSPAGARAPFRDRAISRAASCGLMPEKATPSESLSTSTRSRKRGP